MFDPQFVEALLHTAEGNAHDYKQTQYPLDDDEKKSELIKDIMAFANAWKASDAHILIGVEDGKGKRGIVHGLASHHDDATLQQLVNSKMNRRIHFEYVPTTIDGHDIAIIRIAKEQERPFFLKKAFGKLAAGAVHMRQGSSTGVADADEIARMGAARVALPVPQVQLQVGDRKTRAICSPIVIRSKILLDPADGDMRERIGQLERYKHLFRKPNEPSEEAVAKHRREMALLTRLSFAVKNTGQVLLEDVRVCAEVPKKHGLILRDEAPPKPRGPLEVFPEMGRMIVRGQPYTEVTDRGTTWELVSRIGKVQPDATMWSEPFWIGRSAGNESIGVVARVFADNLPKPVEFPLDVQFHVSRHYDDGAESPADEDDDDETGT